MDSRLRLVVAAALAATLLGCTPLTVPVRDVDGVHDVYVSRTKEEVRDAILEGAQASGWRAKEVDDGEILASYFHKSHAVNVDIEYGFDYYAIRYRSSAEMKMFCSEADRRAHQNMKVSGRASCPGDATPAYIHNAYQQWVGRLIREIDLALGPK